MKQLYNYSLASMREKDEIKEDVTQEYQWQQTHIDPFMAVMMR